MSAPKAFTMTTDPKAARRLLIVEPDNSLGTTLSLVLKLAGYEVHHVDNSRDAIAIHQSTPLDVIIAEVVMPEMDGIELLRTLQRYAPSPKFILLCGKTRIPVEVYSRLALLLGAKHLLRKPIRPEQLVTLVRQVLGE